MSRPRLFVALLLALFVWKLVRTDWIVKCRYEYTDADPPPSVSYGVEFYYPPTSPLWDPPTPEKISGRSDATWQVRTGRMGNRLTGNGVQSLVVITWRRGQ